MDAAEARLLGRTRSTATRSLRLSYHRRIRGAALKVTFPPKAANFSKRDAPCSHYDWGERDSPLAPRRGRTHTAGGGGVNSRNASARTLESEEPKAPAATVLRPLHRTPPPPYRRHLPHRPRGKQALAPPEGERAQA
ncbi:hypothetical protein MRX96_041818 [Rhipicephalus microplus]